LELIRNISGSQEEVKILGAAPSDNKLSPACIDYDPSMLPDQVLVLHSFQMKTRRTAQTDIALAARRPRGWKD